MTRKEAITDLITLKEYFEEQSDEYPISLEYAINELSELNEEENQHDNSRKKSMNMEQAVKALSQNYQRALKNHTINNPMAWALYKTWRMADCKAK